MTDIFPDAHRWFGLCPKHPVLYDHQSVFSLSCETSVENRPDPDTDPAGAARRGVGFILSGIKTLLRNRQLFWFPFLISLVLAGHFAAQYIIRILSVYPYDAIDFPRWIVLTFTVELATVFCLSSLLAGILMRLCRKGSCARPSFRDDLYRERECLRLLLTWSTVMALAGTTVYSVLCYSGYTIFTIHILLNQFPFNFIFIPENYGIGPMGGTYATLSAASSILVLSGINFFLFTVTIFVIPLMVLEKKNLVDAVTGSVALIRNALGETITCFFLVAIAVSAAAATSLLFQVVYTLVAPGMIFSWYPGDGWIAAAILFLLALFGLICTGITVGGIASFSLFMYAKTGQTSPCE
jgi:hypothetical protein